MTQSGKLLRITQVRSVIKRQQDQRRTIKALGIHGMHHSVEHRDTPQIRGMIHKISHLVDVEEIQSKKR